MSKTTVVQGTHKSEWLEKFSKKNSLIAEEKPVKKSKYTSITKLDTLIGEIKSRRAPSVKATGKGVEQYSFGEAMEKFPGEIEEAITMEQKARDQYEGFINQDITNARIIRIGKQADGQTIELETTYESTAAAKLIIIIGEGISTTLIETVNATGKTASGETILIKNEAKLAYARINNLQEQNIAYSQIILEKDAIFEGNSFWTGGTVTRSANTNVLQGQGASAKQYDILMAKGKEHFDLNYKAVHRGENTFSHCVFKAALKGESRNVFDGMILIEESGSKTNALLECHSMILGEKASSNQIPGLEIKTDDVKATHSATVARIEDDEIFYLQSRGIQKEEARKMIVQSFLESIIFLLPEQLRKTLRHKLGENL